MTVAGSQKKRFVFFDRGNRVWLLLFFLCLQVRTFPVSFLSIGVRGLVPQCHRGHSHVSLLSPLLLGGTGIVATARAPVTAASILFVASVAMALPTVRSKDSGR
jgi:hypothetical protein